MNDDRSPSRLERMTASVEKHPGRALAGLVLTAVGGAAGFFFLGFNYHKEIEEAASLDRVPRGSYVLKSDLPQVLTTDEVNKRYIEKRIVDRDYVLRSQYTTATSPSTNTLSPKPSAPQITFSKRRPFPTGYDVITPGMKFSDAARIFPEGELLPDAYQTRLSDGAFRSVLFLTNSHRDADPSISLVSFQLADGGPDATVIALREFGRLPHRSELLGSRVVWPNIDGFELIVTAKSVMISVRN